MKYMKIENSSVEQVFSSYPEQIKPKLMFLRKLIFEVAEKTENVGPLTETLKWGEPSYLTEKSKTGSTVRINWKEALGDEYAIYFKCTSLLVPAFKKLYPRDFKYEGNRAIHFNLKDHVPVVKLSHCIEMALTYHLIKNDLKKLTTNEQ